MKTKWKLMIISIVVLLTACGNKTTADLPVIPFGDQLQSALDSSLEQYGGKGISFAVIIPGYQPWTGVSGISHGTTPITPEMVFDAGSIHKSFTASAVLRLVEEGVLSLDDPISKWLPDYPNIDRTITVRQLLNHTGGVFDMVRDPAYWEAIISDPSRKWKGDETLTHFVAEPYFTKGNGWHYSTPGYILLRMIIEEATGQDLGTVYRSYLFNPLKLENSYLAIYEELPEKTARGWFDLDGDGAYEVLPSSVAFNSSTYGAIFTNAEDLAKWANALFHEGLVLSQDSLDQAMVFEPTTPDEPLTTGYGLGIARFSPQVFNDLEVIGHSGNAAGYAAGSLYLPDYGVSIGIMVNTHAGETMFVINELLNIITTQLDHSDST